MNSGICGHEFLKKRLLIQKTYHWQSSLQMFWQPSSSLRTHGDTKKMAAISSLTATILSHFLYFGRIISIFRILHRILSRTIHWKSLHRCSYFDQIAIWIIETDHLLPPAVCHQPVDIPNIRIQLVKLAGKCFDIRFFEI